MGEPFEAEIKKYTEALAADPKSRVFVPLSDAYRKLGRYDEAILVAKDGLIHHPHYMGGKMALARAYFENGELDPAETLLDEVLNFAADNLLANRLLAQIHLQKDRKDRALPLLKQLQSMEPNDAWVVAQLAKISIPPGPVVQQAEPPPPPPRAAIPAPTQTATLAELYRSQGHTEKGLEIYRKLLAADPANPSLVRAVRELQAPPASVQSGPKAILEKLLDRIAERRRKAA
jgi:tetratricopeptide (TPR) repeat protein